MVELNKSKTTKTNSKNKTTNDKKSKKTKKSKFSNHNNSLTFKGYKSKKTNSKKTNSKKTNSKKTNSKKTKSKRNKIRGGEQIGGNIQFEKPDNITFDSLVDNSLSQSDKDNLKRGLRNFSHFVNLVDWEVNKKFINKSVIPEEDDCQKIESKTIESNNVEKCYGDDDKCTETGKCGRYYSESKKTCGCYPINAIKNFNIDTEISIYINGESIKFKIFKIIEIIITIGFQGVNRKIIILGNDVDCYVVFPFGVETLSEHILTEKINETIKEINEIEQTFQNLFLCGHSMGSALAMATSIHKDFIDFKESKKTVTNVYLILTGCLLYFNNKEKNLFDTNYGKKYIALNVSSIDIKTRIIKLKPKSPIVLWFKFDIYKDLTSRRVLNTQINAQASVRAQGNPDDGKIDIKEFLITDHIDAPEMIQNTDKDEDEMLNFDNSKEMFTNTFTNMFTDKFIKELGGNQYFKQIFERFSPEIFNILKKKILDLTEKEKYSYEGTRTILNIVDYDKGKKEFDSIPDHEKAKFDSIRVRIEYTDNNFKSGQLHTFDKYLKPLIDLITK